MDDILSEIEKYKQIYKELIQNLQEIETQKQQIVAEIIKCEGIISYLNEKIERNQKKKEEK